jgi:hypothetical protein
MKSNLARRLREIGPTGVKERFENGQMMNVNFQNPEIQKAFKNLQKTSAPVLSIR